MPHTPRANHRARLLRPRAAGFTLIELMMVVVILGVLATLAGYGYQKYIGRARTTEAVAMLAEMSSREALYQSEFASYLTLRADGPAGTNESAAGFFPADPTAGSFDSVRTPTMVANPATWPQAWRSIGLRVRESALYCTYMVNAGPGGTAAPAGFGTTLFPAVPVTMWFYGLAVCNLSGPPGFPNGSTVLAVSSQTASVVTFNDAQ